MKQEQPDNSSTQKMGGKNLQGQDAHNPVYPSSEQNSGDEVENEETSLPDDVEADKKETSGQEKKADQPYTQPYPKQKDDEEWKTGTSGIPENASDNPHH